MNVPLYHRKGIPFFYDKSDKEFRQDIYEHYDTSVKRQIRLHLGDQYKEHYPFQNILDRVKVHYSSGEPKQILDIGCGVGRWIAQLAQTYPESVCWGLDFSYQMLKQANDFWVEGKSIELNDLNKGYSNPLIIEGHHLNNLKFGLADACHLPFEDTTQDLIVSSFLFDRLKEPAQFLDECFRTLRPEGRLIVVTPLNFNNTSNWDQFYPVDKLKNYLSQLSFKLLFWKDHMIVNEPMDSRGNKIQWNCLTFVVSK